MKIKNIAMAVMPVFGFLVWTGCTDSEYGVLTNQAYILQTRTDANSSLKLTVGNEAVSTNINVGLSNPANAVCTYRLVYDTEALDRFNAKNETPYASLPEDAFTLSANEVTITEGTSVSSSAVLTVNPYSEDLKNSGKKYALAFRLEPVSGNSSVLESGKFMVYVLDQVVIQPVIVLNRSSYIGNQKLDQSYALTEWTAEFNVNKDVLRTAIGQGNNQALIATAPDEIYTRFGDAPIEGNRLQIKTQGTQMNSRMLFNANTWYHIAFVCTGPKLYIYVNGVLDSSMDMPGKVTNVSEISLCSSSSYTLGNAMYSEMRFWKKARSQKEIQNNMYSCDPTSDGLIVYYKFNEGSGSHIRDFSGNGNDAEIVGTAPVWVPDVRIDGK